MRARINPVRSVTKKQKVAAREYLQQESRGVVRRIFKLFCVVLHDELGIGKVRYSRVLGKVTKMCEEKNNDPVFWSHVDMAVKQIGLDFQNEDYDAMGE